MHFPQIFNVPLAAKHIGYVGCEKINGAKMIRNFAITMPSSLRLGLRYIRVFVVFPVTTAAYTSISDSSHDFSVNIFINFSKGSHARKRSILYIAAELH